MKEFVEFIKNLWQNKKTRSLAILIIYFIFFIFVFSVITPANTNIPASSDNDTNTNTNNPTNNDNKDDELYYLKDMEIINYYAYDNDNNIIENYDANLINGNVIYMLIKNSILESTNYINNSNTYYISPINYEKLINGITTEVNSDIRITITNSNIVLDFSQYYGYKINIDIRS